ncbi:MAG: hypothetical protein AAGD23_10715, partial [Pseudomonadota bacterium]
MSDPLDHASNKSATEQDEPAGKSISDSAGQAAKSSSPSARLKKQAPKKSRAAPAKKAEPKLQKPEASEPERDSDKPRSSRTTSKKRGAEEAAASDRTKRKLAAGEKAEQPDPKPESADEPSSVKPPAEAKKKARTGKKPPRKLDAARPAKSAGAKLDREVTPGKEPAKRRFRPSFKRKQEPIVAAERGIPEDEVEDARPPVPDLVEVTGNSVPPGCISSVIEWDFRPGGRSAMVMKGPEGEEFPGDGI